MRKSKKSTQVSSKSTKKRSSKMIKSQPSKINKMEKVWNYISKLNKSTKISIKDLAKAVRMDVFVVSGCTSMLQTNGKIFVRRHYNPDTKRMESFVEKQ